MRSQIASFAPFAGGAPGTGVQVATTSTTSTTSGADLLVSGSGPGGTEVRKFGLGRAKPQSTTLVPLPLGALPALPAGQGSVPLGGR